MVLSDLEREMMTTIFWLDHRSRTGAKVLPNKEALLKSDAWTKSGQDDRSLGELLERLHTAGLVVPVGELYRLTDEGTVVAKQSASEEFGELLIVTGKSAAYRAFCQKVYGTSRSHYNMATEQQLGKLIEVLNLGKKDRALDLGCGIGAISEHIAAVTGANVLGVDYAAAAIQVAQERTRGKSTQLSFQVMDMDNLQLPEAGFDAIIAIDTLYFVRDLNSVIAAAKRGLRTGGRMGILFTTHVSPDEPKEKLEPKKTPLAKALISNDLDFHTWDYTEDETGVWERQLQAAEELKPAFESEGNLLIYQLRTGEASTVLEYCRTGRSSRYLYCAYP
ncbi:MAG TPA: methyltransferase domain-containing protein [Candidatus Acidoferrales bacterium]|nr:methyltransferase domain-containing protein [Candidatus Acidoferrales bacterium]